MDALQIQNVLLVKLVETELVLILATLTGHAVPLQFVRHKIIELLALVLLDLKVTHIDNVQKLKEESVNMIVNALITRLALRINVLILVS